MRLKWNSYCDAFDNNFVQFRLVYNAGHNILALFNNLAQVRIVTSKRYLISSITNLVHDLSHELPTYNLTKLRNFRKISNWSRDAV